MVVYIETETKWLPFYTRHFPIFYMKIVVFWFKHYWRLFLTYLRRFKIKALCFVALRYCVRLPWYIQERSGIYEVAKNFNFCLNNWNVPTSWYFLVNNPWLFCDNYVCIPVLPGCSHVGGGYTIQYFCSSFITTITLVAVSANSLWFSENTSCILTVFVSSSCIPAHTSNTCSCVSISLWHDRHVTF